jgi:hypothetical protein
MIHFITDEDFDGRIVRGLFRRSGDIDVVRAQDVGLLSVSDENLLEWAAGNNRIVLTHEKRTIPRHVHDQLVAGQHVSGVLVVDESASIGQCVEDILLIEACSENDEWHD